MKVQWISSDSVEHKFLTYKLIKAHSWPFYRFQEQVSDAILTASEDGLLNFSVTHYLKKQGKEIERFGLIFQEETIHGPNTFIERPPLGDTKDWAVIPLGINSMKLRIGNQKVFRHGEVRKPSYYYPGGGRKERDIQSAVWFGNVKTHPGDWEKRNLGVRYHTLHTRIKEDKKEYHIESITARKFSGRGADTQLEIDMDLYDPTVILEFATLVMTTKKIEEPIKKISASSRVCSNLPKEPDNLDTYVVKEPEQQNTLSHVYQKPTPDEENPDAPWLLRLNPLFSIVGWQLWWEYKYVSGKLIKSETQWRRLNDPPK
jgi:hypothetical protein